MTFLLDDLPDRFRLPLDFDPAPLAADLAAFGEADWTRHFVRDNYEGDWSAIPLRAAEGETHPIRLIGQLTMVKRFVDTHFLARAPAIAAVLARLGGSPKAVRLMRLRPGALIREHSDPDPEVDRPGVRLHVPIVTNDAVEFHLSGRPVHMAPGELWYLRLSDPHRAANRGTTDRVHLVIDMWLDDRLTGLLREGAREAA
ncbi:MAG TPA: aspartyl/asparaginyl beta-hydroxylase domain-containing protein [Allosphingosinicella sp.]|nr:aspartyl/asparaginyl beta-hydroxylase domain-containing protein [Allosphingosinicella sp.]